MARFVHEVHMRWSDMDAYRHINNTAYLAYLEQARVAMFRVVGYLPNVPETLVAFLATASLGAIWASCAPEFCARSVLDRFSQIEPTILLAVSGYVYGDRPIDRTEEVAALRAGLPTVQHVVHVPYGSSGDIPDAVRWDTLSAGTDRGLTFEQASFDTPLFVLFSSGTTGKPKAIVHGHGGILLEQLKSTGLMLDVRPGDRMQFFTTTAWMVWNMMISGPLVGATLILLDGNPMHPSAALQWHVAEKYRVTHLGGSPAWLMACRSAGMSPDIEYNLPALRNPSSSGSPLPADGFLWVYEQFGKRVLISSTSGGTDICLAFLGATPLQPVY